MTMTARSIFESDYAIRLAQDIAARTTVMTAPQIFGRLLKFAIIGLISLVVFAVCTVLYLAGVTADANTNTLLLVASMLGGLAVVATLLTSVLFLWDAFINTYVQKIALQDAEVEKEEGDEDQPEEAFSVEIPIVQRRVPALDERGDVDESELGVAMVVTGGRFLHDGDVSPRMFAHCLGRVKTEIEPAQWETSGLESTLAFFNGFDRNASIYKCFKPRDRAKLASAVTLVADPSQMDLIALQTASTLLNDVAVTYNVEAVGDEFGIRNEAGVK